MNRGDPELCIATPLIYFFVADLCVSLTPSSHSKLARSL